MQPIRTVIPLPKGSPLEINETSRFEDSKRFPKIKPVAVSYKQPSSVCRTVSMRWCALQIGTTCADKTIMDKLNQGDVVSLHKDKNKTRARTDYNQGRTDVNTLILPGEKLISFVAVLLDNLPLKPPTGQFSAPLGRQIADRLASYITPNDPGGGYIVSLHYEYVSSETSVATETGAHSVGFFVKPRNSKRKNGAKFFDPNHGAWLFSSFQECSDFFTDEWFPRITDQGTVKGPRYENAEARFFQDQRQRKTYLRRALVSFKIARVEIVETEKIAVGQAGPDGKAFGIPSLKLGH